MMTVEQMAAEYNLDLNSLKSLTGFLVSKIKGNPTLQAAFIANPEAVLKAGIEAWHNQSQKIFGELLEGTTDWAKFTRAALAEETWIAARQKAGLPTN